MLADRFSRHKPFDGKIPDAVWDKIANGKRGLLSLWPNDVIAVVNGEPVTKADVLHAKRKRQARRLEAIRRCTTPQIKPCFVWVFDNGPVIPYGGTLVVYPHCPPELVCAAPCAMRPVATKCNARFSLWLSTRPVLVSRLAKSVYRKIPPTNSKTPRA